MTRRGRASRLVLVVLAGVVGLLGFRAVLAGAVLGEAVETAALDEPITPRDAVVTGHERVWGVDLVEVEVAYRGGALRQVLLPAPAAAPAVGEPIVLDEAVGGEEAVSFVSAAVRVDVEGRTDPARRSAIAVRAGRLYWGGLVVGLLAALVAVLAIDRLLR